MLTMKMKLLAATAALTLAMAGSANALVATSGTYTLDDTSFGAGLGVHFDNESLDVNTADGTINQDGSTVTFFSTDTFDTNTGGEATIKDGSGANQDPFNNLDLTFEKTWTAVTFSFDGGGPSVMTLLVNGTDTFSGAAGGNCSFCIIGNGETKFTITASTIGIKTLQFDFAPDIGSGRQFRVEGVFSSPPNPIPEPATWAMMIMGFGGIGVMMRRRRRRALVAI